MLRAATAGGGCTRDGDGDGDSGGRDEAMGTATDCKMVGLRGCEIKGWMMLGGWGDGMKGKAKVTGDGDGDGEGGGEVWERA